MTKERIGIFADVQNIYYTTKEQFGCHFDYNHFMKIQNNEGKIVYAYAYAVNKGDKNQIRFQNILQKIGFKVKLIPYIVRYDGSAKGDWDVGIALDIASHMNLIDRIILISGDGDFSQVINHVRSNSKTKTYVYGVEALTAKSLIASADQFCPIDHDLLIGIPEKW